MAAFGGHGRRTRPSPTKEAAIAVKEEKIEMEGEILESLRNGMFRVSLDNGHVMIGYTSGKMKRFRIRMGPGDRAPLTGSKILGGDFGSLARVTAILFSDEPSAR